jgi:hypothetical protein
MLADFHSDRRLEPVMQPLNELDRARAEYLWQLGRHCRTTDSQLEDLARAFRTIMRAGNPSTLFARRELAQPEH